MLSSILRRLPKFDQILPVFAVIAFLAYGRSIYIFLFKLPAWLTFLTVGEILSVLAYGLVVNLLESLLILVCLLAICLSLPARWFRDVFVPRGTWLALAALLSILVYFRRYASLGPDYLSALPVWSLATLGLAALAAFLGGRIRFLRAAASALADRMTIFLFLFIPASLISLAVAFIITPWLVYRLAGAHHEAVQDEQNTKINRFFRERLGPFLNREHGKGARRKLWLAILAALMLAVSLAVVKLVVLKMLPFDNKSEFQVVVDMPSGTAVEQTAGGMREIGAYLATVPEVTDYEAYAGTASPINFNGLVRQYYLRSAAEQGDIQVNLRDKHQRSRSSHEIAGSVLEPVSASSRAQSKAAGRSELAHVEAIVLRAC